MNFVDPPSLTETASRKVSLSPDRALISGRPQDSDPARRAATFSVWDALEQGVAAFVIAPQAGLARKDVARHLQAKL
jgi:hypothetical protein